MYRKVFLPEEKIKLFDEIADKYFNRNFGTMMKADIDVMIFSTYIEHLLNNNMKYDDYTIAQELGLTENRVRTLKERKQLKYPYEKFNWKEAFVKLIPTAKYNKKSELVQMCVEDVNLMREIRHYFIEKKYFDEHQLNSKLLQCKLEFFIDVCNSLDGNEINLSENEKKNLKKLSAEDKGAIEKIIAGDFSGGFKELLNKSPEIIKSVLEIVFPQSNLAINALTCLTDIVTK